MKRFLQKHFSFFQPLLLAIITGSAAAICGYFDFIVATICLGVISLALVFFFFLSVGVEGKFPWDKN